MKIEPLMVISAFVAGSIALKLGYTWKEMQDAIIEKISSALPATLILWSVGFLIGALMFSGTVPMIIYYGVQMINPKFLLVTAFILSALLSTIGLLSSLILDSALLIPSRAILIILELFSSGI